MSGKNDNFENKLCIFSLIFEEFWRVTQKKNKWKLNFKGFLKYSFFFGDVNFLTFPQLIKFNSNTLQNSLFHCNKPTSWLIMSVYSARINDVSPVITTRTVRVCVSLEPLHVTLSRIIETRTLCFPLPPPMFPVNPPGSNFSRVF